MKMPSLKFDLSLPFSPELIALIFILLLAV